MSVNDEDSNLPEDLEFSEEFELSDLSSEDISSLFTKKEKESEAAHTPPEKPSFAKREMLETSPEEKAPSSFVTTLKKINPLKQVIQKRRARAKELSLGIDLSRPRPQDKDLDPPSAFQELLQPLSGSELVLLQKDVQADETVYARIDKARASAGTRQRWAVLLTSLIALFYFWTLGSAYLTEILPNANNSWLPEALNKDMREKIVFVLGLILPFLALLITSEGLRLLLAGIFDRVFMALFRGLVTLALAGISLLFLALGQVFLAGLMLVFWLIFKKIIEHPLLRKLKSKQKRERD